MTSPIRTPWIGRCAVVAACGALLTAGLCGAQKNRVSQRLRLDPEAEVVELFAGIEEGRLDVKMIVKDSKKGQLLFENKSDRPVTVKLPEGLAGVHILKQVNNQQFGFPNNNNAQNSNGGSNNNQAQSVGGGVGMNGQGNNGQANFQGANQFGPGQGFFSIQPEKVVQVPYHSVCLNHGKPEPRQMMTYRVVALEAYTSNPTLQELVKMYGAGGIDVDVAQAAAWHVADDLTWQQLADKRVKVPGQPAAPLFNRSQLTAARQLVEAAQARAQAREQKSPVSGSVAEKKI